MTAYGNPCFASTEALMRFRVYVYFENTLILTPFSPVCQVFFSGGDRRVVTSANAFADSGSFRLVFTSLERQLDGQLRGASLVCGKSWMCLETVLRAGL